MTPPNINLFENYFSRYEAALQAILPVHSAHKLHEAMCYSVLNGGKRLRPLLVYTTGKSLGGDLKLLDNPACAVEFIHAGSLIHDDLPSMDNDDIRRGKPTCHKAFGEAIAILAGDALQSLAFEVLSKNIHSSFPITQLQLISLLAQAIGYQGMAYGQSLDILTSTTKSCRVNSPEDLIEMYRGKTTALIKASLLFGVLIARPKDNRLFEFFSGLSDKIGLVFQIQDDLLDIEGDPEHVGKGTQKDKQQGKITYPHLVGIESAKDEIKKLSENVLNGLVGLGLENSDLAALIHRVFSRSF